MKHVLGWNQASCWVGVKRAHMRLIADIALRLQSSHNRVPGCNTDDDYHGKWEHAECHGFRRTIETHSGKRTLTIDAEAQIFDLRSSMLSETKTDAEAQILDLQLSMLKPRSLLRMLKPRSSISDLRC